MPLLQAQEETYPQSLAFHVLGPPRKGTYLQAMGTGKKAIEKRGGAMDGGRLTLPPHSQQCHNRCLGNTKVKMC